MALPHPEGRYRVRARTEGEQSVPQHTVGPRFLSRTDAETFAAAMAGDVHCSVVVEKQAPSGCWLELITVGFLP